MYWIFGSWPRNFYTKMIVVFSLLISITVVQATTKCFEIGCFTNNSPYSSVERPLTLFPQSPESINTQFLLFTRKNIDYYQVVSAKNISTLRESNFDCSKNTVYIVHGYTERGSDHWLVNACRTILQKEDVNCLCVDWSGGSGAIYLQAVNNIQVVGAEIGFFINTTITEFNCSQSKVHIIGHSLGAHAAGEAGKRRPGISRITALDAAGPYFKGTPEEVRLDPSDADFVIAIHTDAGLLGFGLNQLIGHKDFFPNGGARMTGCNGSQIFDLTKAPTLITGARDTFLCSHVASYYVFIETISNPDGFMAYCASDYDSFEKGAGFPCSTGKCSIMGYYTEHGNESSCQKYYLNTGPRFNYERWRYNVTIQTTGKMNVWGSLEIILYNLLNVSDKHKLYSGSIIGGSAYSALIDAIFPGPINAVTFIWHKTFPSIILKPTLGVLSVTLQNGNDGKMYKFCGNETTREDISQILHPCP